VQCYTEALTHSPDNVAVLGNRSAALLMTKRYAAARLDCERLLALDPSYTKAYPRLAKAALGEGHIDLAVSRAREACALEPGAAPLKTVRYSAVSKLLCWTQDTVWVAGMQFRTTSEQFGGQGASYVIIGGQIGNFGLFL
jgi:tetratricopeptide (TPR) repeat protein